MGRMVATVAHEIRNPLGGIDIFSDFFFLSWYTPSIGYEATVDNPKEGTMEKSDAPKKDKLQLDTHSDFFEDSPPDGKIGELVQALLSRSCDYNKNLSIDLVLEHIEVLNKYQIQLENEIDCIGKKGTEFNFAKLEDMIVEREDSLRKIDIQSVREDLKRIEPELVKKKIEEFRLLGIRLRRYQDYSTTLMTVKGPLEYSRIALRPATPEDKIKLEKMELHGYIFPLDIGLGLSRLPHRMSIDTMLAVASVAARSISFEESEQYLRQETPIRSNDDTIRAVTNELGALVYANDIMMADEIKEKFFAGQIVFPIKKKPHTLYLECDGAMIATRKEKDLQETDGNEVKGAIWKENKLGLAFSTDNIRFYKSASGKKNHIIQKRGYTCLLGNCHHFAKMMLSLAIQNGYGFYENTVLISDGADWIKNMKTMYFADATHILDFYHLSEHVYDYAKEIFDRNEHEYVGWAKNITSLLKASKSAEVIKIIQKLPNKQRKKASDDLVTYINHNKDNIDYLSYRQKGFFIGSGAIESGNKIVLQRRLKQGAMRWNIASAQALLSLIAKVKSGLWSDVVDLVYKHYAGAEQEVVKKRVDSLFNTNSPSKSDWHIFC